MQQYFENKKCFPDSIVDGELNFDTNKYIDYCFANYRWDQKMNVSAMTFQNCTFAKMGFKQSRWEHLDCKYTVFIDCYFKDASFSYVDFTGALFINCNFDGASFMNCCFEYVKFRDCYIKLDVIRNNLPPKRYNLTRDLCRNLGLEALRQGDDQEFRKFFFTEKRASEKYFFKKFHHSQTEDHGYYAKYNVWDEINGLIRWGLSKINKCLWGYGERVSRLLINMLVVILVFTIGYLNMNIKAGARGIYWHEGLYISLCNFFTLSPVSIYDFSDSIAYEFISVSEAGIGVILMGFFVAAVFRYINRRS